MSLTGIAESSHKLRGQLKGLEKLRGYSAYEIAVMNGFDGTEEEWLESLRGDDGYEIAVQGGYTGTEKEFLADLANFDNLAQSAVQSASSASQNAVEAKNAKDSIQSALDNLPAGSTVVINDLTTGGATAALSAEMGKVLAHRPNRNLFINWCFVNPVNQRGVTSSATKGEFTVDRWRNNGSGVITFANGYASLAAGGNLQQPFEASAKTAISGMQLTFSVLMDTGLVSGTLVYSGTGVEFFKDGNLRMVISGPGHPYIEAYSAINIIAVKLEYGNTQTLAHWDGSKWVLNEMPNFADELHKCQRYFQLFSDASARPTSLVDYRPNMMKDPTTGTIDIGGVTYYYADANL